MPFLPLDPFFLVLLVHLDLSEYCPFFEAKAIFHFKGFFFFLPLANKYMDVTVVWL